MIASQRIHGLVAAPFTPFSPTGTLNVAVIPAYADMLVRAGVKGVFACGSTGEGASLSVAERKAVAEAWMAAGKGKLRILIHVGHNSVVESRELAAHAATIGADAIAAMAPCYYKPAGVPELLDYCAAVAGAAPKMPFYFYHIPSMTGVRLSVADFLQEAYEGIPSLVGVKFTHDDLLDLQDCLHVQGGAYEVLYGMDEQLLPAVALGVVGAVGSTYNYMPGAYLSIFDAVAQGDFPRARADQFRAVQFIRTMLRFGGLRASKRIMGMIGVDCGPVRSPLRPFTNGEAYAFYDHIRHDDFFAAPLQSPTE